MEANITGKAKLKLLQMVELIGVNQLYIIVSYLLIAATIAAVSLGPGFSAQSLTPLTIFLVVLVTAIAIFLLIFSLWGLISYFAFIPSIQQNGHVIAVVHATHLLHPTTTAFILALFALCVYVNSVSVWMIWLLLVGVYTLHTLSILKSLKNDERLQGIVGQNPLIDLLNLMIGGEIVTTAAGARPIAPWKLETLPENTWIVDVRTKAEFSWNRMERAENFPWGAGLEETAHGKDKGAPVLVTCFSGHRSPAIAVKLKRMGFKTVYNLNWGLLYFMLFQKNSSTSGGPFNLTKAKRDPSRRGKDFKGISVGYISCATAVLIIAPIEHHIRGYQFSLWNQVIGALFAVTGLILGRMSFRALGRNFRVFAAPRRSGTLIISGIYSRIRHPMYIAVILLIGGYALFFSSLFSIPFWIGCAVLYMIKAVKEEALLSAKYPNYADYRKHTWRFIPYVW